MRPMCVSRGWGTRVGICVGAALLAIGLPRAGAEEAVFGELTARFEASKPTVQMQYRVGYRFLHLEMKYIAEATVLATEGVWRPARGGDTLPACLVDFRLNTRDAAGLPDESRGSVSIHNRIVSVLTIPDLTALVYAKRTDQRIHILRQRSRMDSVELFDLEDGTLHYTGHDYQTGSQTNDLAGRSELTRQGREVCRFVQRIAAAYGRESQPAGQVSGDPVYIYTEGSLVPFALRFKDRRENVTVVGRSIPSLHLLAQPKPTRADRGKGRDFEMWTASFAAVSEQVQEPRLLALSRESVSFSMVPLITDLELPLGAIRGTLTDIRIVEPGGLTRPVTHLESKPEAPLREPRS